VVATGISRRDVEVFWNFVLFEQSPLYSVGHLNRLRAPAGGLDPPFHDLLTGSFNFTKQAEKNNAENLLVIEDSGLASKFTQNWKAHFAHSNPYERQVKSPR